MEVEVVLREIGESADGKRSTGHPSEGHPAGAGLAPRLALGLALAAVFWGALYFAFTRRTPAAIGAAALE